MKRILIVGSGDIARRSIPWLAKRFKVYVLARRDETAATLRELGAQPLPGNLDERRSLYRLAGIADAVLHFAPPPDEGESDRRTANLLMALANRGSLPQRLVYISTTGVYGDRGGMWTDETCACMPATPRSRRRQDAELRLRRFGRRHCSMRICILRAGGIYAAERLPLERLRDGLPMPVAEEDACINLIHADDLARIASMALFRGRPGRVYNAVDDSGMKYGEYFDCVADCFGLTKPSRIRLADAGESPPRMMMPASFLSESRRLSGRRMRKELRISLHYPTARDGLAAAARSDI